MTDISFAQPQWVHLIWLVLGFVVVLAWLELRGGHALNQLVHPTLQQFLVQRPSRMRRYLRIMLLGLAGLAMVLAMMRPQWGLHLISTPRVGSEIMIAVDVSRSMLAEDVAPNRLERAKAEIRDLLPYLDGDQVGLIAFAGRASVLSPLTPDFGYFRLVLDEAGPNSVVRGGTSLAEPIKTAIKGFGDSSDVARSLLLITDGEDHDSYALEAAREAAARGITILAIGFGDEAGSEIRITDPTIGAKKALRDEDGNIVISRLNGEILREIAFLTEGAYIPAGTGLLDLESIYQRHISGLTRGQLDGGSRQVRNDAYQWPILLAMLSLVAAVFCVVGGSKRRPANNESRVARTATNAVVFLAVAFSLGLASAPRISGAQSNTTVTSQSATDAQNSAPTTAQPIATSSTNEDDAEASPPVAEDAPAKQDQRSPREVYNDALAAFDADGLDAAKKLFERSRNEAKADATLRFNATYNLGWVAVSRSDKALDEAPEDALSALEEAAAWFSEAVSLRPSDDDARYNLEIVARRAAALADSMAKKEQGNLQADLDASIKAQRDFVGQLGGAIENLADAPAGSDDMVRRTYRNLATQQLAVLGMADKLSRRASNELQGIRDKPEEERGAPENLRAGQLEGVLHYLHQAQERIGQARNRMRRRQGERGYRRASAGLGELKRARDQLFDPVARIDALITDESELLELTALAATNTLAKNSLASVAESDNVGAPTAPDRPGGQSPGQSPRTSPASTALPSWLNDKYLKETQSSLSARSAELEAGLQAGLRSQAANESAPSVGEEQTDTPDEALLKKLEDAVPLLSAASDALASAVPQLEDGKYREALSFQRDGLEKLARARELFFDIRRLVEVAYNDQRRINAYATANSAQETGVKQRPVQGRNQEQAAGPGPSNDASVDAAPNIPPLYEIAPSLVPLQDNNAQRMARLGALISDELTKSATAQAAPATPQAGSSSGAGVLNAPSAPASSGQNQQLETAYELRLEAQQAMHRALAALTKLSAPDSNANLSNVTKVPATNHENDALVALRESEQTLEALRRLFFSVLEHLKDTARRQAQLNDETKDVVTLKSPSEASVGPLVHRQNGLAEMAGSLSEALQAQAQQAQAQQAQANQTQANQTQANQTQANQTQAPVQAQATQPTTGNSNPQTAQPAIPHAGGAAGQAPPLSYDEAAEKVSTAAQSMSDAASALTSPQEPPTPLTEQATERAREQQSGALDALLEAIALLEQGGQQNQDQQTQQQNQQQQQQSQQGDEDQPQQSPGDSVQHGADASRCP